MRLSLSIFLVAIPHGVATAQSFVSSPRGFLTSSGGSTSREFGAKSFGRDMIVDGELRNRPMSIKAVEYRPQVGWPSVGRRWANVTLSCSECDFAAVPWLFPYKFKDVPLTTPTRVFAGPTSWPDVGLKSPGWIVRFPLRTAWRYTGKRDICLDYVFAGGVLQRQGKPWAKSFTAAYSLDSYPTANWVESRPRYYSNRFPCRDSGALYSAALTLRSEAQRFLFPSFDSHTVKVQTKSGPSVGMVYGFAVGGMANGLLLPGVDCNLHLDFSKPTALVFAQANAAGAASLQMRFRPYNAAIAGTRFFAQAAWTDTRTQAMKLTPAGTTELATLPTLYRRGAISVHDSAVPIGTARVHTTWNPIARYAR